MLILGVDPGTARIGWGVVSEKNNDCQVGDYGCLETSLKLSESQRLLKLFAGFTKILSKIKPAAVAVESLFFFKNQTTVIKVAQARGVILLAAEKLNMPIFSYTPLQVKMAVTGYGRAEKTQVQQMVKSILKLNTIPQPDDVADALAIALTHAFSNKLGNKIK
ncbi:MAG: crossover junction endodeoxyribonuclease RuvC [Candidatus Beckwithbacteria bacterium]|nr:crossover junction endodeoxyribonuclease RuvC [Candidatus Beckwithbacteria bacterium]